VGNNRPYVCPLYDTDFLAQWRVFTAPESAPKSASKKDAWKAYGQTITIRPSHTLMLLCIEEYLCDIHKRKQFQAHLATWYRRAGWEGYLSDAQYRLDHPAPKIVPRPSFKAEPLTPEQLTPKRPWREILAQHNLAKGS